MEVVRYLASRTPVPSRSYPRALAFALPLVTLGYLIPLLSALGATDWSSWSEGAWPQIAAAATGTKWIAPVIAFGGMISALALFNALPNSKLSIFPDASHGGIFQYADAFVDQALRFLAE